MGTQGQFAPSAVLRALSSGFCNWDAIPTDVLCAMASHLPGPSPGQAGADPVAARAVTAALEEVHPKDAAADQRDTALREIQAHLLRRVPLEWRMDRRRVYEGAPPGAGARRATLNAQAAGTPRGVWCVGGLNAAAAEEVEGRGEEDGQGGTFRRRMVDPALGAADCSKVYQVGAGPVVRWTGMRYVGRAGRHLPQAHGGPRPGSGRLQQGVPGGCWPSGTWYGMWYMGRAYGTWDGHAVTLGDGRGRWAKQARRRG
jgi:hypothetical protein